MALRCHDMCKFCSDMVRNNGVTPKPNFRRIWITMEKTPVKWAPGLYSGRVNFTLYTYTVYPKKYAHAFCFAVLCCGYTLTDFPISIRLTSLALWQSNDCPSASKATLMNMDKYFMWIHYERLHNHNKAKHNKTVCIFLGINCTMSCYQKLWYKEGLFYSGNENTYRYKYCGYCKHLILYIYFLAWLIKMGHMMVFVVQWLNSRHNWCISYIV